MKIPPSESATGYSFIVHFFFLLLLLLFGTRRVWCGGRLLCNAAAEHGTLAFCHFFFNDWSLRLHRLSSCIPSFILYTHTHTKPKHWRFWRNWPRERERCPVLHKERKNRKNPTPPYMDTPTGPAVGRNRTKPGPFPFFFLKTPPHTMQLRFQSRKRWAGGRHRRMSFRGEHRRAG